MKRILDQTFYELLEVPPAATPEEIERAWDRARSLYGPGSLAAYALLTPDVAEALARRIDEAFEVLLDPAARAAYDASLPPDEPRGGRAAPEAPPAQPAPAPPPPPAPPAEVRRPFVPPEGAAWTGELIRKAREARGMTIAQLSERTKLSRLHIEAVEAERFDQLPVPVYLRGIVMCIARELRLDGQKVARAYLERASAASGGGR
ncbi:MAG TPA: helix-turn-helix domain-containing protein [Anaeromyxobacteraceae bacterium]|nr:helix-turn-helix domain-containing protein [Anaeromyxobacteraceae bacterium]